MTGWTEQFSLTERRALITGASKGIGAEICAVFADAGAAIVAIGRDEDGLRETAARVRAAGRSCTTVSIDRCMHMSSQFPAAAWPGSRAVKVVGIRHRLDCCLTALRVSRARLGPAQSV